MKETRLRWCTAATGCRLVFLRIGFKKISTSKKNTQFFIFFRIKKITKSDTQLHGLRYENLLNRFQKFFHQSTGNHELSLIYLSHFRPFLPQILDFLESENSKKFKNYTPKKFCLRRSPGSSSGNSPSQRGTTINRPYPLRSPQI